VARRFGRDRRLRRQRFWRRDPETCEPDSEERSAPLRQESLCDAGAT